MILRQVSVFLESQQGRMAPVVRHLAGAGVNLRALMLAETDRFGILRFIPDDADRAQALGALPGVAGRCETWPRAGRTGKAAASGRARMPTPLARIATAARAISVARRTLSTSAPLPESPVE